MTELAQRAERRTHPERKIKYQERLGLQGRIVLRDQKYLNLNNPVPAIDAGNPVASFAERNYLPFENTALHDRQEHWQQEIKSNRAQADFDHQLSQWKQNMVTLFNDQSHKTKVDKLRPYLTRIGIADGAFRQDEASLIYERYFRNQQFDQGLTGVKLFIFDVINTYSSTQRIDYQSLKDNLSNIQWLSNIFGEESSEIVAQLIDAEAQLEADGHQFVDKIKGPVNDLKDREKALLKHICTHGVKPSEQSSDQSSKDKDKLPILKYTEEIKGYLSDPNVHNIVISAGTGAGKTTQVPLMAMEVMKQGQKMIVTQPRRLPTFETASRVALLKGEELGERVGYLHGRGKKIDPKKGVMVFMTEGSLKRAIARDKTDKTGLLLDYDKIMFDEVHEMSVDLQVNMALALEIQKKRQEMINKGITQYKGKEVRPLQLIFASATFNQEELIKMVPDAKVKNVEGQMYKVNQIFETRHIDEKEISARIVYWVNELIKKRQKGRTFLSFLPGDRLIRETVNKVKALNLPDVRIIPLSGTMPQEQQHEAIKPDPDKFNTIVSTPVAETSITIKGDSGVDVISSGFVNIPRIDPETGLFWLEEKPHSQKGIIQQMGRGGRTGESDFIFLGTEEEFKARPEFPPNPLTQADLISQVLYLKSLGRDIRDLKFMEPPDSRNVERAERQLKTLGALNTNGSITEIGKQMDKIPADPHLARMIVEAKKNNCGEQACTITAMIESKVLFVKADGTQAQNSMNEARKKFRVEGSDFLTLLQTWREYNKVPEADRKAWAESNYLKHDALEQVRARRAELLERTGIEDATTNVDDEVIERTVVAGFRDKLLRINSNGMYSIDGENLVNNTLVSRDSALDKDVDDPMRKKKYALFVSVGNYPRQREGKRDKIYMLTNQRVDPSWL